MTTIFDLLGIDSCETKTYDYNSYVCKCYYIFGGRKCFVGHYAKGITPIAKSDDLFAYDITDFADYAREFGLSEDAANALHVTNYEENDYTKTIPYGAEITLANAEFGVDDATCTKSVWHKA